MFPAQAIPCSRPFSLLKSLPYKIAGCHPKCQRYIREIRCCDKCLHSSCAHSHNTDFSVSMRHQPLNCCLDSFKGTIHMAIIVFSRRNAEHINAISMQPFCAAFCHIIIGIISKKPNHRTVCSPRIFHSFILMDDFLP